MDDYEVPAPAPNPNQISASAEYVRIACATCGIMFFIPLESMNAKKIDHKIFHCPSGHGCHFPAPVPATPAVSATLDEANRVNIRLLAENDQLRAENSDLKKKEAT